MSFAVFKAILFAAIMSAVLAFASWSWAGETAVLRSQIEVTGPVVTLGDLFENAGPASGAVIAPAPAVGRTATFSPRFVETAARAAGLEWRAPAELRAIAVAGRGGTTSAASGGGAIRKGDLVTVRYATGSVRISARGKALDDAAEGQPVRLQNPESGRIIDAIAEGRGAARAVSAP